MTTTATRQAVTARAAPRRGLDPRAGWVLVGLVTLVVLATWAPSLDVALGDNHEGRILGRHALHVTNAQDHGLAGSGWLSDARPYTTSYSHHPPLLNFGYYLTAQILPGDVDLAMRVFAYLAGVAMVPVGAALMRRLGFGFAPILLAAGAIAVTPLFWSYGRLHANITLLLAMTLVAVRFREDRAISTTELVVGTLVSIAAVVAGYLGLAAGAFLGVWVLARRRLDRVTVVLGIGLTIGAAITALYVVGSTGVSDISDQVALRTTGGSFTSERFTERMALWRETLLPTWWRQALAPIALTAGLMDRRTRVPILVFGVIAVGYIYGLRQGAYIHDYWIFPVLLPVWLGCAALAATVTEHAQRWLSAVLVVVASTALVIQFQTLLDSEVPDAHFRSPEAAGALVRDNDPPDGQQIAWGLGVPTARWMSLYWDLPAWPVDAETLPEVDDHELVLVRLDRLPSWLTERPRTSDALTADTGDYALVTGEDLRAVADEGAGP